MKDSLALLSMIVIICKPRYFNMLVRANQLARQGLEQRIGLVLPLFLGGITDSREFIGHGGKTESNCLLRPILHGA